MGGEVSITIPLLLHELEGNSMHFGYTAEISEYVESHLIAYIGNKRRLLSLIRKALGCLDIDTKSNNTFLTPLLELGLYQD